MTTAYGSKDNPQIRQEFDGLPENLFLRKTDETVIFDVYNDDKDFKDVYEIWEEIIEEGQTYPQDSTDEQIFRQYFLSHNAFVFRSTATNRTVGAFYIKPNFPGRSKHLANCGLAIKMEYRSRGLGHLMMERVVKMAKVIGYEALYTNLVYVSNPASIAVCKKYGFVEVGRLPRAGNLKNLGYTDALQLYRDLRSD